jgi:uncharacterized protein
VTARRVVAGTGALYALIDADDRWHQRVADWWRSFTGSILVPVTVLPEITYLLATRIGPAAEEAFVRAIGDGEFVVEPLEAEDIRRTTEIIAKYRDLPLGLVDASLVAVAERLQARSILTSERRHFWVVRPNHVRSFTLLP